MRPIPRSLTTPCPESKITAIRINVGRSLAAGDGAPHGPGDAESRLMFPLRSRSRQPQL